MEEFSIIPASDLRGFRGKSQNHKRSVASTTRTESFVLLTRSELISAITPEMEIAQLRRKSPNRAPAMDNRPAVFIDGEGANHGERESRKKSGLEKLVQQQNYALLTAVFEDGSAKRIIGKDNVGQLSTTECLDFLLGLPDNQVLISFGFTYDVEMMLRDLSISHWKRLKKTNRVYWRNYAIIWIPHKLFYIRQRASKKNNQKGKTQSRRIFDIAGFFGNVGFKTVTEKWKVATPEEQAFLEEMKDLRSTFGAVTQRTLDYNELEGKLGIRVFNKIRSEWIGLGLKITSPHGAGSLASAMYVQNDLERFMQLQQSVSPSPFKRGYIGGRFDYTQQGEFPTVYESDINSAYPHIMRTLPCLSHASVQWTRSYVMDSHSIWLVRWRDTDKRWALFPYRSGKHIRYHANGIGWYYGSEVAAALRIDPTLEILEGYRIIPECDEQPFGWIETYYNRRQELKASQPFTAEVLKIGMNSGYGKLAQTKGHVPRYQNLMWAGMITSGTRAMLLDAIAQSPENVLCVSTDSVTSTIPLDLEYDEIKLGAWKQKKMEDYLLLGNGFAHSPTLDAKGFPLKDTHRGFLNEEWNWDIAREEWKTTGHITAWKNRFNTAYDSYTQSDPSIRCSWSKFQTQLEFEFPKGREISDGWIWPSENPTPSTLSEELSVQNINLRMSQFGVGVFLLDLEEKEKLTELVS